MDIHQLSVLLIEKVNLLNKEESELKRSSATADSNIIDSIRNLSTNLESMATFIVDPNGKEAVERHIRLIEAESKLILGKQEFLSKSLISFDDQNITYQRILGDISKLIEIYRTIMSTEFKKTQENKSEEGFKKFQSRSNSFFNQEKAKKHIESKPKKASNDEQVKHIIESSDFQSKFSELLNACGISVTQNMRIKLVINDSSTTINATHIASLQSNKYKDNSV
jgi:hypothetical protein